MKYMRIKVTVKDQHGNIQSGEINARDEGIIAAQRKHPPQIFRNKKKYTRKEKHKKQVEIDE